MWNSQAYGTTQNNIFNSIALSYADWSQDAKEKIGLNNFFSKTHKFLKAVKEPPIVLQDNLEIESLADKETSQKMFYDLLKEIRKNKQLSIILDQEQSYLLKIKSQQEEAKKKQNQQVEAYLKTQLKNAIGFDMFYEPPKKSDLPKEPVQKQSDYAVKVEPKVIKPKVVEPKIEIEEQQQNWRFKDLVIGDSFMAVGGGLGDMIEKGLLSSKDSKVYRYGVVSSGLSRPDYFNWNLKTKALISKYKPNIAVVMFGSNDNQGITNESGVLITTQKKADWQEQYKKRVADLLDLFEENNVAVFWIGIPVMKNKWLSDGVANLNLIYETECQKHQNAYFVSTWQLLSSPNGGYTAYLKDDNGINRLTRTSDGVHLTYFGGELITKQLLGKMKEVLSSVSIEKSNEKALDQNDQSALFLNPTREEKLLRYQRVGHLLP